MRADDKLAEVTTERLADLGRILIHLSEQPETVARLRESIKADDAAAWHSSLKAVGVTLPDPETCVTMITIIGGAVRKNVCRWAEGKLAGQMVQIPQHWQAQAMLEMLVAKGLVVCSEEIVPVQTEHRREFCKPPFPYGPGPSPERIG